ncbi:MAG: ABC transporter permease [Vescimonas sp.]
MKRTKLIVSRILQIIPIFAGCHDSGICAEQCIVQVMLRRLRYVSRGMQITEESLAAIREELGLNAPIYLQYWNWLKNAVRFDFGNSFQTGRPVSEEILSRFPATLELALVATLISLLMSIPLAVLSARYKGSAFDHGIRAVSSISATMPDFLVGPDAPVLLCSGAKDRTGGLRE